MKIKDICALLEEFAPPALQESYDNSRLLLGNSNSEVTGVLVSLDVTEEVIDEAIENNCNMIVAHHPLIFGSIKSITGKNYVERTIIKAIKHDVAVYAMHTNLDNVLNGVNGKIADRLNLINRSILRSKKDILTKLVVYVPDAHLTAVREAIFDAGGGVIGNYDSCSFSHSGTGTFRAGEGSNPFVGEKNKLHQELELRLEVVLPNYLTNRVVAAMSAAHPYEEVAYDLIPLANSWSEVGTGIVGELSEAIDEHDLFELLKSAFNLKTIRHTAFLNRKVKRIALCGGAGSSFLGDAMATSADVYISGDFKYHEFFNAENRILIADIGHYESEQFTKEVIYEIITKKIPNFAIRISEINTNPINYY